MLRNQTCKFKYLNYLRLVKDAMGSQSCFPFSLCLSQKGYCYFSHSIDHCNGKPVFKKDHLSEDKKKWGLVQEAWTLLLNL